MEEFTLALEVSTTKTTTLLLKHIEGIALMDEYLFCISPANLSSPGIDYVTSSYRCLSDALEKSHNPLSTPRDAAHTAFLDTSTGLATLILLFAARQQLDPQTIVSRAVPSCIEIMMDAILRPSMESSEGTTVDDGCEVLYGRAGLLYALLRLRAASGHSSLTSVVPDLQPLISDRTIGQVVEKIIQGGIAGSAAYSAELSAGGQEKSPPPLIWRWHGKRYLGGAHGVGKWCCMYSISLGCEDGYLSWNFSNDLVVPGGYLNTALRKNCGLH